jgi:hypothetical protein
MSNKDRLGKLMICRSCGWFGYKIEFENNICPNCFKYI